MEKLPSAIFMEVRQNLDATCIFDRIEGLFLEFSNFHPVLARKSMLKAENGEKMINDEKLFSNFYFRESIMLLSLN